MDEGIVDLAPISDQVPAEIVQEVEAKKQAIINKEWDVFTGPIKAQDGSEKVAEGQVMTDAEMLSMDWFVAGVQGTL
jgi:basic membrane protein A